MDSVKAIADHAKAVFASGRYEEAIPLLQEWAKKSNCLANMISGGLEPFYNASCDDAEFESPTPLTLFPPRAW
ncbi:MAG: hypothetical protein VB144_14960 [Clostridia bacterium]|nr:hypothetical protein [Clostridia bacterium]